MVVLVSKCWFYARFSQHKKRQRSFFRSHHFADEFLRIYFFTEINSLEVALLLFGKEPVQPSASKFHQSANENCISETNFRKKTNLRKLSTNFPKKPMEFFANWLCWLFIYFSWSYFRKLLQHEYCEHCSLIGCCIFPSTNFEFECTIKTLGIWNRFAYLPNAIETLIIPMQSGRSLESHLTKHSLDCICKK